MRNVSLRSRRNDLRKRLVVERNFWNRKSQIEISHWAPTNVWLKVHPQVPLDFLRGQDVIVTVEEEEERYCWWDNVFCSGRDEFIEETSERCPHRSRWRDKSRTPSPKKRHVKENKSSPRQKNISPVRYSLSLFHLLMNTHTHKHTQTHNRYARANHLRAEDHPQADDHHNLVDHHNHVTIPHLWSRDKKPWNSEWNSYRLQNRRRNDVEDFERESRNEASISRNFSFNSRMRSSIEEFSRSVRKSRNWWNREIFRRHVPYSLPCQVRTCLKRSCDESVPPRTRCTRCSQAARRKCRENTSHRSDCIVLGISHLCILIILCEIQRVVDYDRTGCTTHFSLFSLFQWALLDLEQRSGVLEELLHLLRTIFSSLSDSSTSSSSATTKTVHTFNVVDMMKLMVSLRVIIRISQLLGHSASELSSGESKSKLSPRLLHNALAMIVVVSNAATRHKTAGSAALNSAMAWCCRDHVVEPIVRSVSSFL